jgi:hypothetical protein
MAPTDQTDPLRLPIRWEFIPFEDARDKSIRWKWRATTHSGELIKQSTDTFETRIACEADAKAHGYTLN